MKYRWPGFPFKLHTQQGVVFLCCEVQQGLAQYVVLERLPQVLPLQVTQCTYVEFEVIAKYFSGYTFLQSKGAAEV